MFFKIYFKWLLRGSTLMTIVVTISSQNISDYDALLNVYLIMRFNFWYHYWNSFHHLNRERDNRINIWLWDLGLVTSVAIFSSHHNQEKCLKKS